MHFWRSTLVGQFAAKKVGQYQRNLQRKEGEINWLDWIIKIQQRGNAIHAMIRLQ